MKIRTKLFINTFAITGISLIILGILTFSLFYKISSEQIDSEIVSTQSQLDVFIEKKVDEIDTLTEKAEFYSKSNYDLLDDIKKYQNNNYKVEDFYHTQTEVRGIFKTLLYRMDEIKFIALVLPNGKTISYSNGQSDIKYDVNVLDESWYQNTLDANGNLVLSVVDNEDIVFSKTNNLFFSRGIYDLYSKEMLGVLTVVCSPEYFEDSMNILPNMISKYALTNEADQIIFQRNIKDLNGTELIKSGIIETNAGSINYTLNLDRSSFLILLKKVLLYTFFIIICLTPVIIWVVYKFSEQFTKPIFELSKLMKKNKQTDDIHNYSNNIIEIDELFSEYNRMHKKIDENTTKIMEYEQSIFKSELNLYKNQINSHFLYNTLESINSIAEIEGLDKISNMTVALSKMFRYSSKSFTHQATLKEEIDNIGDYLEIQKIRFQNQIEFSIVLDDLNLYTKTVPKLILQPIVENSIFHGFKKGTDSGTICLIANEKNDYMRLRIIDNGTGIPPLILKELNLNLANSINLIRTKSNHIGLLNVDARLKHIFGKKYGIKVYSQENIGTIIEMKIPLEKETTKNDDLLID